MCPERVPHLSAVQNFLQLSLLPKGGEEEQPTYSELEERRRGARGHISGNLERLCQTSRGAQLQLSLAAATLHNHHGYDRGTKDCFGRDRRRAKSQRGAWRERGARAAPVSGARGGNKLGAGGCGFAQCQQSPWVEGWRQK